MTFSILIPAYKPQFLAECIDSILAQTYTDFEVIVVNDASPYDIDSIVAPYSDKRLRYYTNKTGFGAERLVDNWNHCLEFAIGEYVMCMGDDDKLLPNCLKDYAIFIQRHPNLSVYHTRTVYIDDSSNEKKVQAVRPETESVYSSIWHRLNGYYRFCIGEYMFDTTRLREAGGFFYTPMAWAADDLTVWNTSQKSSIGNLPFPGFMCRESSVSISGSMAGARDKVEALLMMKRWIDAIETSKPDFYLDQFYLQRIPSRKRGYISRFCKAMIGDDIVAHPISSGLYWRKHKRFDQDISLNDKEILHYLYIAIKRQILILLNSFMLMFKNTSPRESSPSTSHNSTQYQRMMSGGSRGLRNGRT